MLFLGEIFSSVKATCGIFLTVGCLVSLFGQAGCLNPHGEEDWQRDDGGGADGAGSDYYYMCNHCTPRFCTPRNLAQDSCSAEIVESEIIKYNH